MLRIIILALGLLLSGQSFAQSPLMQAFPQGPAGARSVNITVNLSSLGATIPADFVGLSADVGDFVSGYYQGTTGANGSFCALARLMAPTVLNFRLGGNNSDNPTAPTITSGMASGLNSFLGCIATSYKLIYGLDAVANNPTAAASTASTIATAVGVNNVIFQFGNEPSINGFTISSYQTMWNSYYTAVTGAVSGAKFAAIDDGFTWDYPTVIGGLTPGLAGLSYVTSHWYSYCRGTFPNLPSLLISQPRLAGSVWTKNAAYAASGGVKQRLTESNSICALGQNGSSNAMMAATFFINEAIIAVNNGWAGIDTLNYYFQPTFYNPFVLNGDNTFSPTPIFYALDIFAKISGQQIAMSTVSGSGNVVAIATKNGSGTANIVLANDDVTNAVTVTIGQTSPPWSTATVLVAQASDGNGCNSFNPQLGGQPIGKSGSWTGAPYTINSGQPQMQISPCGVAAVQTQP